MTEAGAQAINVLRSAFATLNADERALFEERAALMEFDGGMTREIANREALWDVLRQRRHARA